MFANENKLARRAPGPGQGQELDGCWGHSLLWQQKIAKLSALFVAANSIKNFSQNCVIYKDLINIIAFAIWASFAFQWIFCRGQ